jgi:hypothetical protein
MGIKIFVSYKYADWDVRQFSILSLLSDKYDTARSYVDLLEDYIKNYSEHIYKGENDGEDLSKLDDQTIQDKLYDRIYDSTLTIVLISPNMRDVNKPQKHQWIPQEISYSLREQSRTNSRGQSIKSRTNGLLAIVLPNRNGSYSYFLDQCFDCHHSCITYKTNFLFEILRDNSFNIKKPNFINCKNGMKIYDGDASYIVYVKWDDFAKDPEKYINKACETQNKKDNYDIRVQL